MKGQLPNGTQLLLSNERFTSRVITGNCDEPSRRRENDDSKVLSNFEFERESALN